MVSSGRTRRAVLVDNLFCQPYNSPLMKAFNVHGSMMTTGSNVVDRDMVPLLIMFTSIAAVLAGPLFSEDSIARAQLDASRPQSVFRLVGTIEGGPFTGAVIDDARTPQAFYRLNEKLPDDSQIVKVRSDYIVLKWPDGTRTELYLTPGSGGGGASAAPAPQRRVDQPVPERIVNPNRNRVEQVPTNPSAGSGQDAAGRWTRPMDRQNPDKQGAQVQDPSTRKKSGGGRRSRPRSNDDN